MPSNRPATLFPPIKNIFLWLWKIKTFLVNYPRPLTTVTISTFKIIFVWRKQQEKLIPTFRSQPSIWKRRRVTLQQRKSNYIRQKLNEEAGYILNGKTLGTNFKVGICNVLESSDGTTEATVWQSNPTPRHSFHFWGLLVN